MLFNISGFVHSKGSKPAPNSSEYEVKMNDIHRIMTVQNGILIDGFYIQVVDETQPVYAIISSIYDCSIAKFDAHLSHKSGGFSAKPVLSSDIGATLTKKLSVIADKGSYIKIRRNNESYYAGDVSELNESVKNISFEDLLEFVSGKLSWNNLKGRSYLVEKKIRKELSSQQKNAEMGRIIKNLKQELASAEEKLENAEDLLEKIPEWIKNFFNK
jgi:hypothetical protein